MNKEDIEKILNCDNCKFSTCEQCQISYNDKKKIREYIEEIEADNYEANNIINSYIDERQAVIDKLKEDIFNIKSNPEYDYIGTEWREHEVVGELEEILDILEGENEQRN